VVASLRPLVGTSTSQARTGGSLDSSMCLIPAANMSLTLDLSRLINGPYGIYSYVFYKASWPVLV
jgi:hypothetical protein